MGNLLKRIEITLCVGGIATIIVIVILQIIGRILPWSFPWTEEVARYLFIWTTMLGVAAAVRHNEHVSIRLGETRLSKKANHAIDVVSGLLSITFFVSMLVLGLLQVITQYKGQNMAFSIPLPLWIVSAAIPWSFGVATVWMVARFFETKKSGESEP